MVVGSGGYVLAGGEWRRVVVGGGGYIQVFWLVVDGGRWWHSLV